MTRDTIGQCAAAQPAQHKNQEALFEKGINIPNLGAFYFGELIIQWSTRRLTMIRVELGSPTGGSGSVSDVDTNGTWSD